MITPPRYPIYIPSKGRATQCFTANWLQRDQVPFRLVIEPGEIEDYAARYDPTLLLVLPHDQYGLLGARNWIRDHAEAEGHERHWQLDDNIRYMHYRPKHKRMNVNGSVGFRVCEDFSDRYENIAISGLQYRWFVIDGVKMPPFYLNSKVYSCTLINHAMPYRWRLVYNDDVDICLQALAGGWCTVVINAFCVEKIRTMLVEGGNTTDYQGDGRLTMARSLERVWPGVVTVNRRFQRPQHVVHDSWKKFDTPLKLKPDIDLAAIPPSDYGLVLNVVRDPKSPRMRAMAGLDPLAES